MGNRVVITGMGTVNPLGLTIQATWENLIRGKSGIGPITLFDSSDSLVRIACEIKDFDPERYMTSKQSRRRDRFQQFALAALHEAMEQSDLAIHEKNADRVGIIVSTAVGGLESLYGGILQLNDSGPRRISPFLIPKFMPNGASGMIAIESGARGPCFSIASACASASDSLGQAWLMIRSGIVDACIAGGAEATITRLGINAFDRLGALSRQNMEGARAPSPFDKDRDGLVMGEGAAVLILEDLDHAKARDVSILAELVGYGSTTDAHHVTAPMETGAGAAAAMERALQSAGLNYEDVDYINAHGTGTILNDIAETKAIKLVMQDRATDIPISSTKSMTGHLMGATGALESIFCVQAIRTKTLPPTINLITPDPECDLDYVPNEARSWDVKVALNNAFGFGGHNAVLAFKSFPD
jgi:beta-ketoacyl-acyl-carrier-protein synthase II